MAAEAMATIRVEEVSDTYLDYDLYLAQQTWDDEDWDFYYENRDAEECEREIAWEEATEEQKREGNFYDALYWRYSDETFAMNKELPKDYCVTWYVANVWPRFVLWHKDKPLAGFKHENKQHVVPFAKASPEARETMVNDFHDRDAVMTAREQQAQLLDNLMGMAYTPLEDYYAACKGLLALGFTETSYGPLSEPLALYESDRDEFLSWSGHDKVFYHCDKDIRVGQDSPSCFCVLGDDAPPLMGIGHTVEQLPNVVKALKLHAEGVTA